MLKYSYKYPSEINVKTLTKNIVGPSAKKPFSEFWTGYNRNFLFKEFIEIIVLVFALAFLLFLVLLKSYLIFVEPDAAVPFWPLAFSIVLYLPIPCILFIVFISKIKNFIKAL